MDTVLDSVAAYYSDKLARHGATAQGLDWRDQASQEMRFTQIAQIFGQRRAASVIDVGCGWGAFALWASRNDFQLDYTGYDISREQIDAAREACKSLSRTRFEVGHNNFAPVDFVIASGIFNVRFGASDKDWREHVDRTIDEMARAARVGFAFNFLTGYSDADRKVDRLYYPYPGEMLDAVMSRHGRHARLLSDYGLYDFTICVWKHAP